MSREYYATLHVGRYRYQVAELVDEDGATRRLTAEEAREQFDTLTPAQRGVGQENKVPTTVFDHWWKGLPDAPTASFRPAGAVKVLTWKAELITAEGTVPIDLGRPVNTTDAGYPIQVAMRLLERLAADGWRLMHVSEDHGLYRGADAPYEAYLTRVRYVLARSA